MTTTNLSVIIPVFNEEDSLPHFIPTLFDNNHQSSEIIFVDDGSSDRSLEKLKEQAQFHKFSIISLPKHLGKTAALSAGFAAAKNDWIATIDADLENNPSDLFKLASYRNDFDFICGWRKDRWLNKKLSRRIPTIITNFILAKITGIHLHDLGCGLKIFKKRLLNGHKLLKGDHRYLPIILCHNDTKIIEIPVSFSPRKYGQSKYGLERIVEVAATLPRVILNKRH